MGPTPPRRLPPGLEVLVELALDLRWTWSHAGDALWARIDPDAWEQTRNPWLILLTAPYERLEALAADEAFRRELQALLAERRAHRQRTDLWFHAAQPAGLPGPVAYFVMELGVGEALPLYAGGLGVLAGDHLKTASDLGVPLVGVCLLYQRGYFRQLLDAQGEQQELYPYNDPLTLPIEPAREPDGDWLRVAVPLPGRELRLRVWQVRLGRVRVLLLDSNDPLNSPLDRGITGELYPAAAEPRLLQELALGFGGWEALRRLGLEPSVCHLNEGHTAFAALARALDHMRRHGTGFAEARAATRAGNLFTTHTPVQAGFDRFDPALVCQYLALPCARAGASLEAVLALGRERLEDGGEAFNMSRLALALAGRVNGVSRLHGAVSRELFQPLFPRWPRREVPVGHVTNAVHVPSWDSAEADALWTRLCGKERWLGTLETLAGALEEAPAEALWELRARGRRRLVEVVRRRLARQLRMQGAPREAVEAAQEVFDPDTLTVGFARRFTAYKRPLLLLHDEARLVRILTDPRRPVQLVVAGKAHPADDVGRAMVARMARFARRPEVRDRVVFLADYDMALAEELVQGVDLWLNTPRRPLEACGTSGMKLLVNGGLNCSELDGWWDEAYTPEVGWALGDRQPHATEDPAWDAREAEALYTLLEREIVPAFYERDARGIPPRWVAKVRASMARLTPRYSTNRMLREYVERHYVPAAESWRRRCADGGRLARELARWAAHLERHWARLRFIEARIEPGREAHRVRVQVHLDEVPVEWVRVEAYAEGGDGRPPLAVALDHRGAMPGTVGEHLFEGMVPADRPVEHYTPRIVPHHPEAAVPLECARILWLR